MNIASSLISVVIGIVIPGLTALITKEHASDRLKAFLTALLAAVTGGLNGALTALPHGWTQWEAILWQIFVAWVAAGVAYLTGWKPTGASNTVTKKTATFGLPLSSTSPGVSVSSKPAEAGYVALIPTILLAIVELLILAAWSVAVIALVAVIASIVGLRVRHLIRPPLRR